jgi:hypothetical protein
MPIKTSNEVLRFLSALLFGLIATLAFAAFVAVPVDAQGTAVIWLRCNANVPGSSGFDYWVFNKNSNTVSGYNQRTQTLNDVDAHVSSSEISIKQNSSLPSAQVTVEDTISRATLSYHLHLSIHYDDGDNQNTDNNGSCQVTSAQPVRGNQI